MFLSSKVRSFTTSSMIPPTDMNLNLLARFLSLLFKKSKKPRQNFASAPIIEDLPEVAGPKMPLNHAYFLVLPHVHLDIA